MFERIRLGFRRETIIFVLGLLAGTMVAGPQAKAQDKKNEKFAAPITKGQQVVFVGHSFQYFVPPILDDMARLAGIEGHGCVVQSYIGGSRVIQHWDVPEEKNKIKQALRTGNVDVLALAPLYLPDEGIKKFTTLALEHNPEIRITIQDIWLRWDVYEPTCKQSFSELCSAKVDHNAVTGVELRERSAPLFESIDNYVRNQNQKQGKPVLFVVPAGQAVIALREKVIAGKAPGIKTQEDLFLDPVGHGKPPLEALVGYCYFSVIYRRSPLGLPMPQVLAKHKNPHWNAELNRLLQEVAWETVTHHPISGVQAELRP
jgi:hypothetical protein